MFVFVISFVLLGSIVNAEEKKLKFRGINKTEEFQNVQINISPDLLKIDKVLELKSKYKVAKNGDFGSALGFDITVELRGKYLSSTIQYTFSQAKASSSYDEAAFGSIVVDAPLQEFLMPYDRTHDLTLSLYSKKLPWGLNAGITGFLQSGYPYTALYTYAGGDKIAEDLKNKNGMRSPSSMHFNLSLSKDIKFGKSSLTFGVNIFNVLDEPYAIDIYELTGKVDDPGTYYERNIGYDYSGTYFDRPWMKSNNREINFFIGVGFN